MYASIRPLYIITASIGLAYKIIIPWLWSTVKLKSSLSMKLDHKQRYHDAQISAKILRVDSMTGVIELPMTASVEQ